MLRVPTATASLGTAVAILLATLGNEFTRSSWLYSVLAALGVVLGAGSALAQLRKGRALNVFEGLAALGGVTILAVGSITGIARLTYLDQLSVAALVGTLYGMPLAAIACFVGGLGQFPASWRSNILPCVAGPAVTGYLAIGEDTLTVRLVVIAISLATTVACIFTIIRIRNAARSPASRLATAACLILAPTMLYAVYAAAIPATQLSWAAPPALLAWAYIAAALCATIAGFVYRKPTNPPEPASPPESAAAAT